MKIKDTRVLITGAASGIGRALAEAIARRGGRLALADCDADRLEAATAAIGEAVSQSLRAAVAGAGVRILVVYPNYTETDLFKIEKKVGGARRPDGPYEPANRVAGAIVKAMETEKRDLILTVEGKALSVAKAVLPGVAAYALRRMAAALRDEKEVCHA